MIVYGWAAMPPELTERFLRLCGGSVEFVGIFGQTEAIACHRWWPNQEQELHAATAPAVNYVGVPTALLGSTVVDAEGRSLHDRPGEAGEAVYRSPAMASGYYRDEAATLEAFRGGWFHSGDMCTYDERGLRIMVDRYKDVVKSGGENVSSIRVESVLAQHPAVARAAVVGLPDERWGEAVVGVVVLAPGTAPEPDELISFCRARLAGYETPKRIVVVDELPATVGGKVLKYRLRQQLQPERAGGAPFTTTGRTGSRRSPSTGRRCTTPSASRRCSSSSRRSTAPTRTRESGSSSSPVPASTRSRRAATSTWRTRSIPPRAAGSRGC